MADMRNILFQTNKKELAKILETYLKRAPNTLTSQFENRCSKEEAIIHQRQRKEKSTEFFPSGKVISQKNISEKLSRN